MTKQAPISLTAAEEAEPVGMARQIAALPGQPDHVRETDQLLVELLAKSCQAPSFRKEVIPAWNPSEGIKQYPFALAECRSHAGLSQAKLAEKIDTYQGNIARMEGCDRGEKNIELRTLERWGAACSYEFVGMFLRTELTDPDTVIARLGVETTVMKYSFDALSDALLRYFMRRLYAYSDADTATCYLVNGDGPENPLKNELILLDSIGVRHPDKMGGLIKQNNPPMRLLFEKPQRVDPNTDPKFQESDFRMREKVRWLLSIPFACHEARGIIFLSYRSEAKEPSLVHDRLLAAVPDIIHFLLAGGKQPGVGIPSTRVTVPRRLLGFAEIVKQVTAHGLTDAAIHKLFSIATDWFESDELCWTWAEIDDSREHIELRCASYRGRSYAIERPIHTYRVNGLGVIAEAARTGTYVLESDLARRRARGEYEEPPPLAGLPEMMSELAVPLNRFDGRPVGVLNVESPRANAFTDEHAQLLEEIGQAITLSDQAHKVIARQHLARPKRGAASGRSSHRLKDLREQILQLFDALVTKTTTAPPRQLSEQLRLVASVAIRVFDAAMVDIWQYDRENKQFLPEQGAHATNPKFSEACTKHKLQIRLEDWWPRPTGNSCRMMDDTDKAPRTFPHAERDLTVSHATRLFGIKSLIGVPVAGPESVRPEGIVWIRFNRRKKFTRQFIEATQTFASFIHMLWNPIQYHLREPFDESAEAGLYVGAGT